MKKNTPDWNGYFITASQEAYDLLVADGYIDKMYSKIIDGCKYLAINDRYEIIQYVALGNHYDYFIKQFYVVDGRLSATQHDDKETDSLIRKDLPKESETQKLFDECESIIGDRVQDYGETKESFSRIAGFWSAYLKIEVSAKDVALMLSLFKIAREQGKPSRDNIVDGINYLALSEQL